MRGGILRYLCTDIGREICHACQVQTPPRISRIPIGVSRFEIQDALLHLALFGEQTLILDLVWRAKLNQNDEIQPLGQFSKAGSLTLTFPCRSKLNTANEHT